MNPFTSQTFSVLLPVAAMAAALTAVTVSGCTRTPQPGDASHADRLAIQLAGEPASLDPALAEDGASLKVLCNTMEGLVGYDGGGKLIQMMAESYEVSPDGR